MTEEEWAVRLVEAGCDDLCRQAGCVGGDHPRSFKLPLTRQALGMPEVALYPPNRIAFLPHSEPTFEAMIFLIGLGLEVVEFDG